MANILVIAEKPNAAQKIAYALGKTSTKKAGKVRYFETKTNEDTLIVVPAAGHLFSLAPKEKGKYPIFDLEWKPLYEVSKGAAFTKAYTKLIENQAKRAESFVVATDYDIEGELIGLNCLRFLCKQKDAKRMKFSTLTAADLREAYENILSSLDWGQAEAGETRHYLDWMWGVNLSHAIMSALLEAKIRKILSIGRVQGPALALLTKREQEIEAFVPKPYWQIAIQLKTKPVIEAKHHKEVFWDKKEAVAILNKIKGEPARVAELKTKEEVISPPTPFDLTSLQMEAWRALRIPPKATQQIAQELYTRALISYPRTSSQKLPATIGYKKIISLLAKQTTYKKIVQDLLTKPLKPKEGKKTDPAHPAIYPTGEKPLELDKKQKAVYDLITRRFLATFAQPGRKEIVKATFQVKDEHFHYTGSKIIEEGWRAIYKPFLKPLKDEIPALLTGELIEQQTKLYDKQTMPPKRFTPASIIRELEKRKLGTKATRSQIIDTLFKRGYVTGTSIRVTQLGKEVVKVFEKFSPAILSESLTRHFEAEMELIRERKKTEQAVLDEAKKVLVKLVNDFNLHKNEIGVELAQAVRQSQKAESYLMKCPVCSQGDFRVIRSKKTKKRFLACSKYPECKTTWPLPQQGKLQITEELHGCGVPLILLIRKDKRPWKFCPNPACRETKKD